MFPEYTYINTFLSKHVYINIPMIIAQKAKRLTIGKGILFDAENDKLLNFLNNWYTQNKIYIKLLKMEETLSLFGRCGVFLWMSKDNKLQLDISSPAMMSMFGKMSEIEQVADCWIMAEQSMNPTFWRVRYTPNYTTIETFKGKGQMGMEMIVNGTIAKVADSLTPLNKFVYKNNIGILPCVEIINIPRSNIYSNSMILNAYSDCYSVYNLIDDVQENIAKKRIQRKMVQPRAYGTFSAAKMKTLLENPKTAELADIFIDVGSGGYDTTGSKNGFEIVKASPEFSEYILDQDNNLKLIFNGSGYEYDKFNDVNYTNKTESLMNNKLDIETTQIKRQVRYLQLNRIFDYLVINEFPELWDANKKQWKDNEKPYDWHFIDADILNEVTKIDFWEKRLSLGLATRTRVISELDQVNKKVAEKEIKNIDKEYEDQNQKLENDDNKQTKDIDKEV